MITPHPTEAPAHSVRITQSYFLGIHEVTQSQYQIVMGQNPSWHSAHGPGSHLLANEKTSDWPVDNVTWYQAVEFCTKLSKSPAETAARRSYRLPTEAEWEFACRAGRNTPYRFVAEWFPGDKSGVIAGKVWTDERLVPRPVGSYPENEFGLFDMCGNVYEWTNDWFHNSYYARSPAADPLGPAQGYLKVIRGWHWIFTGPECVTNVSAEPWRSNPYVGFRVVCEVQAP
jgi:formylglycine-generating enzyme required for sulfatase activity